MFGCYNTLKLISLVMYYNAIILSQKSTLDPVPDPGKIKNQFLFPKKLKSHSRSIPSNSYNENTLASKSSTNQKRNKTKKTTKQS